MTVTDCHRKEGSAEKETRKKISLFGKGLQTTDIDLHSTYIKKVQKSPKTGKKRRQCRKGNTQKISLFGKGLQMTDIDLHSTYIKKMQKSSKNWENVGRCTSYTYFTHARKKVKISST